MSQLDPADLEAIRTLEAELRQAIQHRRAAQEQEAELRAEVEALIARANALLSRSVGGPGGAADAPRAAAGEEPEVRAESPEEPG